MWYAPGKDMVWSGYWSASRDEDLRAGRVELGEVDLVIHEVAARGDLREECHCDGLVI